MTFQGKLGKLWTNLSIKCLSLKTLMTLNVVNVTRQLCINKSNFMYKPPKILIVHLKRFEIGYYSAKKVTTTVELDNNLDMVCKNSTVAKYNLMSIVHHTGSLNSGHYQCEIKENLGNGKTKWYSFNDEVVSPTQVNACTKT